MYGNAYAQAHTHTHTHTHIHTPQNKDLLYGNARKIISQKYTGVGDVYVPLQRLQKMESERHPHGQPLADFFFGSWNQGFVKPHDTAVCYASENRPLLPYAYASFAVYTAVCL